MKLKNYSWNTQISPDRSQRQNKKLKIVVELNERKRNGEDGLFFKYIHGGPVIATKN